MKPYHAVVLLAAVCLFSFIPFGFQAGRAQTGNLLSSFFLTASNSASGPAQTNFPAGTQTIYAVGTITPQEVADQAPLEVDVFDAQGKPLSSTKFNHTDRTGPAVTFPIRDIFAAGANGGFPNGGYCALAVNVANSGYSVLADVPFTIGSASPPDCNAISTRVASGFSTVNPNVTATPNCTFDACTATPSPTATANPNFLPPPPPPPSSRTVTPTITPSPILTPTLTPTATATFTPSPAPTATPVPLKHFVVVLDSSVHPRRFGNLTVTVHGTSGHPVKGVRVTVNGRAAGLSKLRVGKTDSHGHVTFKNLWPPRSGQVTITALKSGWWHETVNLTVR